MKVLQELSKSDQEQQLLKPNSDEAHEDLVVTQTPENQEPEIEKKELRADDFGKTSYRFKDLNTTDIWLFVLLSVLLVLGGLILIGISTRNFLTPFPIFGLLSLFTSAFPLFTIGVLLVVSPIYINRFIFHAARHEKELRERAQNATREAGLLQDILTHDIRNYNQVVMSCSNIIDEEAKGNQEIGKMTSVLLNAVERSTIFVDRAKMLGKIISDHDFVCRPTDLVESIKHSFERTQRDFPDKKIICTTKIGSLPMAPVDAVDRGTYNFNVMADDLLNEVFFNLFSNSAKFTHGNQVFIAIELKRESDKTLRKKCWKVIISDVGEGIPDNMKGHLFSRYTSGAKEASGLGMSIVHALVLGRYGGRIQVRDRVEKDHSKGALLEIWLPIA